MGRVTLLYTPQVKWTLSQFLYPIRNTIENNFTTDSSKNVCDI